jgi:uncharacterized protein (DUF433 family)
MLGLLHDHEPFGLRNNRVSFQTLEFRVLLEFLAVIGVGGGFRGDFDDEARVLEDVRVFAGVAGYDDIRVMVSRGGRARFDIRNLNFATPGLRDRSKRQPDVQDDVSMRAGRTWHWQQNTIHVLVPNFGVTLELEVFLHRQRFDGGCGHLPIMADDVRVSMIFRVCYTAVMIVSDPRVMLGKPVIQGTRVTVEAILEKLALGMTRDQILEAYPHLKASDISDALRFAVENLNATHVFETPIKAA